MNLLLKHSIGILLVSMFSTAAMAQNLTNGTYFTTQKGVMKVEVEGYGDFELTLTHISSAKNLRDPLAVNKERITYRVVNADDLKNIYATGTSRILFLHEKSKIIRYTFKDSEGDLASRVTVEEVFGLDKKQIKKATDLADYKLDVIEKEKILIVKAEAEKIKYKYDKIIENADRLENRNALNDAMEKYKEALALMPNETYPKEKISEIEGIQAERKIEEEAKQARIAEETAKRQLPAAAIKSPSLEAKCLAAVREKATRDGWKEEFYKVIINSKEWYTNRNEFSGRILSRTRDIIAVAKWPDGHCTYQVFSVRQNYDGVKYGSTFQYGIGDQKKIACENAQ